VLDTVGLGDTGKKRTGNFSLGMKQRLGIAIALLHNPSLLVLDEPTNGLDPEGIIEMRTLLKNLNTEQGITILISSHLLSEIERMVTHAGIIHQGQLLFQGTLDQLKEQQSKTVNTVFHTSDQEMAGDIIRNAGILPISQDDVHIVIPTADKEIIARLVREICRHSIDVYEVTTSSNDLESIFINLTKTRS
jgi:ABC-2 type transport system ATP-binding protein